MDPLTLSSEIEKKPYHVDIFGDNWLMFAYKYNREYFKSFVKFSALYDSIKTVFHKNKNDESIFDLAFNDSGAEKLLCDLAYAELKSKDDINTRINKQGETLFLVSLRCENYKIATELLERKDNDGNIRDNKNTGVISRLSNWLGKSNNSLSLEQNTILESLVLGNFDANTVDNNMTLISLLTNINIDSTRDDTDKDSFNGTNTIKNFDAQSAGDITKRCNLILRILERPNYAVKKESDLIAKFVMTVLPKDSIGAKTMCEKVFLRDTFDVNVKFPTGESLLTKLFDIMHTSAIITLLSNKNCMLYERSENGSKDESENESKCGSIISPALDMFVKRFFCIENSKSAVRIINKIVMRDDFEIDFPTGTSKNYDKMYHSIVDCAMSNELFNIAEAFLLSPKMDKYDVLRDFSTVWALRNTVYKRKFGENLIKKIVEQKDFSAMHSLNDTSGKFVPAIDFLSSDKIDLYLDFHVNDLSETEKTLIEFAILGKKTQLIKKILEHPKFVIDPSYNYDNIKKDIKHKYSGLFQMSDRSSLLDALKKFKPSY